MTEVSADADADVAAEAVFTELVTPLRSELHAHCYRMLGSTHDADDALQDALLRAWRSFSGLRSPAAARSWLYTVATRTCLDSVQRRARRALPMDLGPAAAEVTDLGLPLTEIAWLGPYPSSPITALEQRESIELAFVAALQHLPGNQRAALLLTEVLGYSAAEVAEMLDASTASVNSALQRARQTVATKLGPGSQAAQLRDAGDDRVRALVRRFADALEQGDAEGLIALLTADVTWSMPPFGRWFAGLADVRAFARAMPLTDCGRWRHRPVEANGQPAVACYLSPDGSAAFRAWSIDVLTVRDGLISDVTSFIGIEHFAAFGLPTEVDHTG